MGAIMRFGMFAVRAGVILTALAMIFLQPACKRKSKSNLKSDSDVPSGDYAPGAVDIENCIESQAK